MQPAFEKTKKELGATAKCDEDVLSYIAFPEVDSAFFKDREAGFPAKAEPVASPSASAPTTAPSVPAQPPAPVYNPNVIPPNPTQTVRGVQPFAATYQPPHLAMGGGVSCEGTFQLTVNGKTYEVGVEKAKSSGAVPVASVPAAAPAPAAAPVPTATPAPVAAPAPVGDGNAVPSPMPGNVFKVECTVGQSVNAGDVLLVLEAMKMEIEVSAPSAGTVKSIAVSVGAAVNTGDILVTLG